MHHPFAGIVGLAGNGLASNVDLSLLPASAESASSRRTALKVMLAGVGTTLSSGMLASGGVLAPIALAAEETTPGAGDAATGYAAYVVVPRDFRTFRADRRQALGVLGDYYRGEPESKNLRGQSGFLAWLTADAMKNVAAANDVADVVALTADDKPGPGTRKVPSKVLQVLVIPGGWKTRPAAGTFAPTAKLIEQWTKQLAGSDEKPQDEKKPGPKPSDKKPDEKKDAGPTKGVTFKAGENEGAVIVEVGDGAPPKDLLDRLKAHPQVVAIEWKYAATTEAVGEEGGASTAAAGEEGGASTKALGEEGTFSTYALGEEGGPTTRGLGEEGGATTLRVGEEGGSTERLGEEGGGVSTKALGEEGGVTTMALGEEGGPMPKPAGPAKL